MCKNKEDGFLVAKEIIKRSRALVNTATTSDCDDSEKGLIPRGVTPLWVAAEKTQNLKLVKLLLLNGGLLPLPVIPARHLSLQGKKVIKTAKEQINQEKAAKACLPLPIFT